MSCFTEMDGLTRDMIKIHLKRTGSAITNAYTCGLRLGCRPSYYPRLTTAPSYMCFILGIYPVYGPFFFSISLEYLQYIVILNDICTKRLEELSSSPNKRGNFSPWDSHPQSLCLESTRSCRLLPL